MQVEDVATVIALRIRIVQPPAVRACVVAAARAVAADTGHLVRYRKHHARFGEKIAVAVVSRHSHQRVEVLGQGVVVGRDRYAVGNEHAGRCIEVHHLRRRLGTAEASQALASRRSHAEEIGDVVPEIGLADREAVDRAVGVGHGLEGHGHTVADHAVAIAVDQLGAQVVERWQYREHRVVCIHAVHAQIVPAEQRVAVTAATTTVSAITTAAATLVAAHRDRNRDRRFAVANANHRGADLAGLDPDLASAQLGLDHTLVGGPNANTTFDAEQLDGGFLVAGDVQ